MTERWWPEQWAVHVAVESDRLERRLPVDAGDAVRHHVGAARAAAQRPERKAFRGLRDQWRGTSVDRAYRNLHTAKIFLVDVLPDAEVDALVPDVSARLATVLRRTDPRRIQIERALRSRDRAVRRAALRQAMETAYDASDEEYARLRDFRNIILLTAAAIAGFLAVLAIVAVVNPAAFPLCFAGVCPTGVDQPPSAGDLLLVAGLGAVGGGLAALFAIRNLRGTSTPYALPVALAVLKVPAGALTAVAGLLLLGGGFAPGFSNLDSQRQILAYALVLGYAQQLLTRLVDDRGQALLDKVPSKDSEGQPPDQAIGAPEPAPAAALNGLRPARDVANSG